MQKELDAKEIIRLRLIGWQVEGWAKVPALTGAEVILNDLDANGFKIVRKDMTEEMLDRLKGSSAAQSQVR